MSTRANILFKDAHTTLFLYRHSDGYPSCTGMDLIDFCKEYQSGGGHMRENCPQSAGWLIKRGHDDLKSLESLDYSSYDWKVGNYEPTHGWHSDIEFFYIIDLENKALKMYEAPQNMWDKDDLGTLMGGYIEFADPLHEISFDDLDGIDADAL